MRIRYMTLPEEWDGERFKERFAIVIDRTEDDVHELLDEEFMNEVARNTGAVDVMIFNWDVEIGESK